MNRYQVIVVGAGPAGSTAGRLCAEYGLETLLLDRSAFPRKKICAGGVTCAAVKALGFTLPDSLIERECRNMLFKYRSVESMIRIPGGLYTVERQVFDEFIANKAAAAGARFHQNEPCLSLETGPERVVVHTDRARYEADLVIGADGAFSTVRRALFGRWSDQELNLCLHANIPLSEREIDSRFGSTVHVHYGFEGRWYAYVFPGKESVAAGIGVKGPKATGLPESFRRFLASCGLAYPERISGAFLPVSLGIHASGAGRVLLAGDAAGFVDAFTGEGIRYALLSGAEAAAAAVDALGRGRRYDQVADTYHDRCLKLFGNDLAQSIRMSERARSRPRLVMGPLCRDKAALQRYLLTTSGDFSQTQYITWLKRRMPLFIVKSLFPFFKKKHPMKRIIRTDEPKF